MKKFNFGCIIKILLLVLLVVIGVFAYVTCSGTSGCACQRIDKSVPDASVAPYRVNTVTFYYFAKQAVTNGDGSVTMTGWYEKLKNKWIYHEGDETLPPILKPRVERR